MKRSEINDAIRFADRVFEEHRFLLPGFAAYRADDWRGLDLAAHAEILQGGLGWDVTDFGMEAFSQTGLTLFTLRNHSQANSKPYAEKVMICQAGQVTPMHYHWNKMEDIINRGGDDLEVVFYHREQQNDALDRSRRIEISVDAVLVSLAAGEPLTLKPGQSVCIPPLLYHSFKTAKGGDYVFAGEVSMANDDHNDNRFLEPIGRFSAIEEDEAPLRLLCSDYQSFLTNSEMQYGID